MDSPVKGFCYYMLNVLFFCFTSLLTKLVFQKHPEVNAFQMLLMRAGISSVLYLALINVNFKKIMIDSVTPELRFPLAYRTIQGCFTLLLLYHAVKYLPLVQVALIINLMPLFTAIFGYLYLKERLSKLEIIVLIVSFGGVTVLILGGPEQSA